MAQGAGRIVHHKRGIAAVISEEWGWMPSDWQVWRWCRRYGLPYMMHATHLCADEDRVREWARKLKPLLAH